jgi:hypothetical protein
MASLMAFVMLSPAPKLGFSRAEHKLLELALLDCSDREAATKLGLSAEAIKKRWRSLYANVAQIEPALPRSDLSGVDQRAGSVAIIAKRHARAAPY